MKIVDKTLPRKAYTTMPNNKTRDFNLDPKVLDGSMKQQASAHGLEVVVPKEHLEPHFNQYWAEVKDRLHPSIVQEAMKGGFREVRQDRAVKAAGGISEFYKPVLGEVLFKYLDTQERQALTVNDINAIETPSNYIVRALVHLEPEVKWKKPVPGVDAPLTIKVPKEPDGIVDRLIETELVKYQQNSVTLVNAPDQTKPIEVNQVGVFNCESTIDGEPWKEATFTAKKWLIDRNLFQVAELYDACLGMVPEQVKNITLKLGPQFKEKAGKDTAVRLQLIQVYDRKTPAIDDDLAKTNGFDTLDALKADLRLKVTEYLKNSREQLIQTSIINSVVNTDVVDVDPVPFLWMTQKAKEIYLQSRNMVKTEEDLIATFKGQSLVDGQPVVNKDTALMFLAQRSAQQLVSDLILRSWGRKAKLEGDSTLDNIRNYAESVKKAMRANAVLEEYVVEEAESKVEG